MTPMPLNAPTSAWTQVTAFTNEEEAAVGLTDVVPFPLETKLVEQGAVFEPAGLFQEKVVVDGRLITGQNPASATVRAAVWAVWAACVYVCACVCL
jgi:putative intracellular protease/amidase